MKEFDMWQKVKVNQKPFAYIFHGIWHCYRH